VSAGCQAAFTLIRVRVRVRVRVCLHGLPRVALYCKQCYITWTLHYVRHDNDIIIDVKTFWRPFLLFSWRNKMHCTLAFRRSSLQNPHCCEMWTAATGIHSTRVYCNPYTAARIRNCTPISVNAASVPGLQLLTSCNFEVRSRGSSQSDYQLRYVCRLLTCNKRTCYTIDKITKKQMSKEKKNTI